MDRFIVKKPRVGAGFPQSNQMMPYPANAKSGNLMSTESLYFNGGYPQYFQNIQQTVGMPQSMNPPHWAQTQHQIGQTTFPNLMMPQSHMSGIDPRYLVGYADNSPQYIVPGQLQRNQPINSFGSDDQNRIFSAVDRYPENITGSPQVMTLGGLEPTRVEEMPKPKSYAPPKVKTPKKTSIQSKFASSNKPNNLDVIRNDVQQLMSRADKLKALNKSGPRAFSGPVEKVLKWHKSLQEVGVLVIYEIVGKCVSIRPGESCAKNLVVRDDNGPAIQVVYYEIDFLLPELKPPCTVRVVGRMMAGTCRLQAFNVRPASGDDVATLPRRAAVATHHVAKLCKEYGHNGQA